VIKFPSFIAFLLAGFASVLETIHLSSALGGEEQTKTSTLRFCCFACDNAADKSLGQPNFGGCHWIIAIIVAAINIAMINPRLTQRSVDVPGLLDPFPELLIDKNPYWKAFQSIFAERGLYKYELQWEF